MDSSQVSASSGILYIVATPIGNLADLSARAVEVLGSVDLIAAEDTRHSGKLMQYCALHTPMQALHEHNERELAPRLVEDMLAGRSIALISDAGTPLISDPGFNLLRLARQAGLEIVPVPGPSSTTRPGFPGSIWAAMQRARAPLLGTSAPTCIGERNQLARNRRMSAVAMVAGRNLRRLGSHSSGSSQGRRRMP